jgi:hypothetical protein
MSGAAATTDEPILVTADQVSWSDSPVIPNAKGALLVGDPSKAGAHGQTQAAGHKGCVRCARRE